MNFARGIRLGLILLVVAVGSGCPANRYEIEMQPRGEALRRELQVSREVITNNKPAPAEVPAEELAKIAAAYEPSLPEYKRGKNVFVNEFVGELPDDVGGSGSYTHWETPLGSVSAYIERFRGDDDLFSDLENRQQAVDRLCDLLIGWLAAELEGEPGFEQLRAFLQKGFRRDLRNLSLYVWAGKTTAPENEAVLAELCIRIGQYLVERSYFSIEQLPTFVRAANQFGADNPHELLRLAQRAAAARMGIAPDAAIPERLGFLADATALEASINGYLRKTDEYRRLLEKWEFDDEQAQTSSERPQPSAVIGELIQRAFFPSIVLQPRDRLDVKLDLAGKPLFSNGEWNEQAGQVRWLRHILPADSKVVEPPELLYAVWSEPNEVAQTAHFGRMILQGGDLAQYCLWYRGLTADEAQEWNEFVASLQPHDQLVERIRRFRFAADPPRQNDETDQGLSAIPRELLLRNLNNPLDAD